MTTDFYLRAAADNVLDLGDVKDLLSATKGQVNVLKTSLAALNEKLSNSKFDPVTVSSAVMSDIVNEKAKYVAIHDEIVAQGF